MDYIVKLQNFEGPFDLLWELIQQKEMDIFDIQISEITNDYIERIKQMDKQDMDVMASFLDMASKLLHLKSKMLLPTEQEEAKEEFIQQLIDYQEYKKAAERLQEMKEIEERYFKRQKKDIIKKQQTGKLQDIASIYQQVLEVKDKQSHKLNKLEEMNRETLRFRYSIEEQMAYLQEKLATSRIDVYEMFMGMDEKEAIVETFGAILELSKTQYIVITSDKETVYIERREN